LGYQKFYSQVQILDLDRTSVCAVFQALTPSGMQSGGLANGPSVLSPSLALFHDMGGGAALQGFVGQDIQANSALRENLERGVGVSDRSR
jgi:hypothetical protein